MPHTLIGIGATIYWVFLGLWALFGVNLNAVVTGTDTSHSSKGTTYSVKYQYRVDDQTRSGSGGVSAVDYERLNATDDPRPEVTVRYFSLGPWEHARLWSGGKRWGSIGPLTLWVAFWDFGVGLFLYMLWIKPLRVRRLYKHGDATRGTLTGKRVQHGKREAYYVSYSFNDPVTGATIRAEREVCNKEDWSEAREGQPVIVLFAPDNPKRNTVYEFGGYHVDFEGVSARWG